MQTSTAHNIVPYQSAFFANQCHFIARFEVFDFVLVENGAMTLKLKRLLLEFSAKSSESISAW